MGKLGFYVDADVCSGCRTCMVACKDRHDLPVGVNFRKVHSYEVGKYPNAMLYHIALSCNHCTDPACVRNCPTGAMFICEDGTIQHDDEMCIYCLTCTNVCPYLAPVGMESLHVVHKCDSCKPLRDVGMNPICVDACPMRVLEFGDLDELRAKHEDQKLVDKLAPMPEPGTIPSVLLHAKECAFQDDYEMVTL